MFLRRIVFIVLILGIGVVKAQAQESDFCDAISTIARDAPNQFRNIRGKVIGSMPGANVWQCGVKVPGSIASRFVASMGLFYEGAFLQTKNKEEVKGAYDKYKELLRKCLAPQGYKMSLQDNFYPDLGAYKKVVFMPELKDGVKAASLPAHISMEATYSKDVGNYTIVIYVFEH